MSWEDTPYTTRLWGPDGDVLGARVREPLSPHDPTEGVRIARRSGVTLARRLTNVTRTLTADWINLGSRPL